MCWLWCDDASLRLESGERLTGRSHLLSETSDHPTRRIVLVESVT